MVGLAFPCSELPDHLVARHQRYLDRRRHVRGTAAAEYRFHCKEAHPGVFVWHGGQLELVRWGHGAGLPRTSWTWANTLAERWENHEREEVLILAQLGQMAGVWYPIFEGVRGLLVTDERGQPVVYMLVQPASHYYQVMTRASFMPCLLNQVI